MPELSETEFHALIKKHLGTIEEQVLDLDDDVEAVPTPGVLTIEFPEGGPFVLSQQTPARELWLSANFHAYHYYWDGAVWRDTKSDHELFAFLSGLLAERMGLEVSLTQ